MNFLPVAGSLIIDLCGLWCWAGEISSGRPDGSYCTDNLCRDHSLHHGPYHCLEASGCDDCSPTHYYSLLLCPASSTDKHVSEGHQSTR